MGDLLSQMLNEETAAEMQRLEAKCKASALFVMGIEYMRIGECAKAIPQFQKAATLGHVRAGEMLSRCRRALRGGQGYL